jgi:hypothetical protein
VPSRGSPERNPGISLVAKVPTTPLSSTAGGSGATDLDPVGADQTEVTLTYDWSRVPPHFIDIEFPPFSPQHLDNSLKHLAELAERD